MSNVTPDFVSKSRAVASTNKMAKKFTTSATQKSMMLFYFMPYLFITISIHKNKQFSYDNNNEENNVIIINNVYVICYY